MEILLAITFVFGVVYLLTLTQLFKTEMSLILNALVPHNEKSVFGRFCQLVGVWFFYFSLCFQAWWWIFKDI